jgi:hypothetical protein
MATAFDVMVATLHNDPNLAIEAILRRGGSDYPVRVILTRPEEPVLGAAPATAGSLEATFPIAAAPIAPERGDLLVVEGVARKVERRERDEIASQWRLILSRATA